MVITSFLKKVRVTWAVVTRALKGGYKRKKQPSRRPDTARAQPTGQPRDPAATEAAPAANNNNNTRNNASAHPKSPAVNGTSGSPQGNNDAYSCFGQVPIPDRSQPVQPRVPDTVAVRRVVAAMQPAHTHAVVHEQDEPAARGFELSFATQFYAAPIARRAPAFDDAVRLQLCTVRGDGRCLFRSVVRALRLQPHLCADAGCSLRSTCDALGIEAAGARSRSRRNGRVSEHRSADLLRFMVVDLMRQHESLFTKFSVLETRRSFAGYLAHMSKPGTHGGEPELLTISKLLQVPVLVYTTAERGASFKRIMAYGAERYRGPPLRVLYTPSIPHYDALIAVQEAHPAVGK